MFRFLPARVFRTFPTKMLLSIVVVVTVCSISLANDFADNSPIPPSPSPEPSLTTAQKLSQDRPVGGLRASLKLTDGEVPTRVSVRRPSETQLASPTAFESRPWMITVYEWDAPATRNLPLLFEEPNLERLGYTSRWYHGRREYDVNPYASECFQPLISGVHFVGRIPLLPCMMWLQSPHEPVYSLGVDRPGSPVCYRSYGIPFSQSEETDDVEAEDCQNRLIP